MENNKLLEIYQKNFKNIEELFNKSIKTAFKNYSNDYEKNYDKVKQYCMKNPIIIYNIIDIAHEHKDADMKTIFDNLSTFISKNHNDIYSNIINFKSYILRLLEDKFFLEVFTKLFQMFLKDLCKYEKIKIDKNASLKQQIEQIYLKKRKVI